jgi:transposase
MGPVHSRSYPGKELVHAAPPQVERAKQELDHERRSTPGYVFGALEPKTGSVLTKTFEKRNSNTFVAFLEQVEGWIDPRVARVYAVLDNLATHHSYDVLLFSLAHPRWEFVFQPRYAAYLNLIEPWWKTLKSLALQGRRFESWVEIERAVEQATAYWNAHKHPYVWGRRRRHKPRRELGVAAMPSVAAA